MLGLPERGRCGGGRWARSGMMRRLNVKGAADGLMRACVDGAVSQYCTAQASVPVLFWRAGG